jgi:transposase
VASDSLFETLIIMPRAYPAEFKARAVALVRAGKEQRQTAADLGVNRVALAKWVREDRVDRCEIPGGFDERVV